MHTHINLKVILSSMDVQSSHGYIQRVTDLDYCVLPSWSSLLPTRNVFTITHSAQQQYSQCHIHRVECAHSHWARLRDSVFTGWVLWDTKLH